MDGQRIKIRCPSCGMNGKARAELTGRRVSCKHCSHIFRAHPIDEPGPTGHPIPSRSSSGSVSALDSTSTHRIESLEVEIRAFRDDRSAREAEHAEQLRRAAERTEDLERRLADDSRPNREWVLLREIESLRDQLGAATASLRFAEEARGALARELAGLRAEIEAKVQPTPDPDELDRLRADRDRALAAAEAEAHALADLRDELDRVRDEIRSAEDHRREVEAASLDVGLKHADEIAALRVQADDARSAASASESLRREFGEAIAERDRLRAEAERLATRAADADRLEAELEASRAEFRDSLMAVPETIIDPVEFPFGELGALRVERDRLRAEADARAIVMEQSQQDSRDKISRLRAELDAREGEIDDARAEAERVRLALQGEVDQLRVEGERLRSRAGDLAAAEAEARSAPAAPPAIEAEAEAARRRAVDEAVKGE